MHLSVIDVYYLTIPVMSGDHAVSLSQHLSEAGIPALPDGNDGVVCTVTGPDDMVKVHELRAEWAGIWMNTEPGLHGLQLYVKPEGFGD